MEGLSPRSGMRASEDGASVTMPGSMANLSAQQLDDFRQRLLAAKASAEALLGRQAADTAVEASGPTIGRLTRIDALQMQAMSQMNRHQLDIRLRQIEAALLVLDQGRYGLCRLCKDPIDLERLEAIPEAPFCLDCQEGMEG